MISTIKRTIVFILLFAMILCMLPTAVHAKTDFKIGVAVTTGSSLRLRESDSLFSKILDHAEKGEFVVVLDRVGDWYKVNYNLQEGYMHKNYLRFIDRENVELGFGKVCGDVVRVRSGPSTQHQTLDMLTEGTRVYIIGINNGWYKIIFDNEIGYMRSDYVELTEIPYENHDSLNDPLFFKNGKLFVDGVDPDLVNFDLSNVDEKNEPHEPATPTEPSQPTEPDEPKEPEETKPELDETKPSEPEVTDPEQEEDDENEKVEDAQEPESTFGLYVVDIAKQYLGTPYVWGGKSPSGFDCSGFVYYVFNQAGYPLSRSMSVQYRTGTPVEKEDLQPGDIVFFQNTYTTGLSHVGIYVGGGQFIHSPSTGKVVSYANLYSDYYVNHYYGACRITK